MDLFVPCLVPPSLPSEGDRPIPSSVLLDFRAYISADAVSNSTTAVASMSNGCPVQVSFCLASAPQLSYLCVHFPGPAVGSTIGTLIGPPAGTPAVECVSSVPHVISTHAELALIRVPIPGSCAINEDHDYFVYTARPQPGRSSLDLLPKSHSAFGDYDAAILRCPDSPRRYVVACLRNTIQSDEVFRFQLYDSDTGRWFTRMLRVDSSERDKVLPIPDTATQVLFHENAKVIMLGGPNGTVGWVDLWRGILFCNVLDKMPVLRDMPLPKPARRNRRDFCQGCPHTYRDITVAKEQDGKVIKYVEMEHRPGEVLSSHSSDQSDSDTDDEAVANYWRANIWTMPVPISSSWKDWHKDCAIDVTDIVIDNPKHSELLLPLPRHSADPKDAKWSFRRLLTAHPTLGLGMDGDAISFLSKVDIMDSRGWVISVDIKSGKLNGVAELDNRKNSCFRRYCVPSEISNYLINARGEAGTLVKTTRFSRRK